MNSGQIMFILGAFAMLSMLALNVNRTMIGSLVLGLEMESTLNALSIGQSMLDEVMQKNFDEKTLDEVAYAYSDITASGNLGPESGESITGFDSAYTSGGTFHDFQSKLTFNDVDDYKGYTRKVWDSRLGYFEVTDSVKYVSETSPNTISSTATFYKMVVVVVRHPNLPKATDTSSTSLPIILRDISIYRQYF
ncbi:MAG TPA: hypothetical protein DEP53_01695 [Bacteroidetes bacterium]|nr:hypothetical protein [Bacteroidota bacterium]